MTYRTDRQLGDFLRFLDERVGAGQWSFALTADHGVAPVVEYAQQFRLPAKRSPLGKLDDVKAKIEAHLRARFNEESVGNALRGGPSVGGAADAPATGSKPFVQKMEDYQVFLQQDHPLLLKANNAKADNFFDAQLAVRDWLLEQPYVVAAFTREDLIKTGTGKLFQQVQRTFHPQRSGDVLFVLAPYTVPGAKGTTHGSPWHYDTHVPLLLLGCGIQPGPQTRPVSPASIASTLSELAGVDYPSANSEPPLRESLK